MIVVAEESIATDDKLRPQGRSGRRYRPPGSAHSAQYEWRIPNVRQRIFIDASQKDFREQLDRKLLYMKTRWKLGPGNVDTFHSTFKKGWTDGIVGSDATFAGLRSGFVGG